MKNVISDGTSKVAIQLDSKGLSVDNSLNNGVSFNELLTDPDLLRLDNEKEIADNQFQNEASNEAKNESELTEEHTYVDIIDEGHRVLNELGKAHKLLVNESTSKPSLSEIAHTVEGEIKKSSEQLEKGMIVNEQDVSGNVKISAAKNHLISDLTSLQHQEKETNLTKHSMNPLEIFEDKKDDFNLVSQPSSSPAIPRSASIIPMRQPTVNHDISDSMKESINKQISEKIKLSIDKNLKNIDIRLDPPELGRINVRLSSHNDTTNVHFIVSNPNTKELIEMTLHRVRDLLVNSGFSVDQATVQQQSPQNRDGGTQDQDLKGWASENNDNQEENIISKDIILESNSSYINFYA